MVNTVMFTNLGVALAQLARTWQGIGGHPCARTRALELWFLFLVAMAFNKLCKNRVISGAAGHIGHAHDVQPCIELRYHALW
jgi:hypothetical protein